MREQLEQALLENPDEPAGYAVCADWLAEQGDPRGEFIHVQLALEDETKTPAERKRLQQREKELLAAHEREWLGSLAVSLIDQDGLEPVPWRGNKPHYEYRWARGWLDEIRVQSLTVDFARRLVASPEIRLLRRLIIEDTAYEEDLTPDEDVPEAEGSFSVHVLRKLPRLENLRAFQLGGIDEANCHTNGEPAAELVASMPRLEDLNLQAHGIDTDRLFALPMPYLRGLRVDNLQHYPCEILAANASLTNLERIQFWPHALEYDDEAPYLTLEDARAIARSPHLQSLTHLQLRLCSMGDEGCRELVESGLLSRLRVLDLMHGEITDEGALILAECPQIRNIQRLVVTGNAIGNHGLTALRTAFPAVEAEQQWHRTGDEEFPEYLYYGDME